MSNERGRELVQYVETLLYLPEAASQNANHTLCRTEIEFEKFRHFMKGADDWRAQICDGAGANELTTVSLPEVSTSQNGA
jgi:hypothetical protein